MIKRLLFTIVLFSGLVSALGISPAIVELDFVPGQEYELTYTVFSDNPELEVELIVGGDFAKYVTIDKERSFGTGTFKLKIKLPEDPNEIEKPGEHRISVGAKEKPVPRSGISTSVSITGHISIFVPYPGRYAEAELVIPNGNVNELIPVDVYVINRGKENLSIYANVKFFDSTEKLVYTLPFEQVLINTKEDMHFKDSLNTSNYRAGNYFAEASVDYGGEEEIKINQTFRIGSLFVNITNFTDRLPQGGIQKFYIEIESMWNDNLESVYADVNVSNDIESVKFRTPNVDLVAWNKNILEGFLDTTELEGKYKTDIALYYEGVKSYAFGELVIEKGLNFAYIITGIAGIVAIIIIIFLIWILKKNAFKMIGRRR